MATDTTVYRWIREGTLDATTVRVGKRRWLLIHDGGLEHGEANARRNRGWFPCGWGSLSAAAHECRVSEKSL